MLDRATRVVVIGLQLFLGVGAVFGAVSVVPTLPLEWLAGTPFSDYIVPALALGCVGAGAFVSAALLVLHLEWGVLLSVATGAGIALFEIVETLVIGLDVWLHALGLGPTPATLPGIQDVGTFLGIPIPLWLQPFYFLLGLVIVVLALRLNAHQVRTPPRLRSATT